MAEGEQGAAAQCCMENKQSAAASASSVSEGSGSISLKSPGGGSPPASPSHRRTTGPIRRAKGGWTPEEDETLRNAVATYNGKSWKKIAEFFPDRSEVQCLHRWQKVLNPDLIKGPWTQEEDEKIVQLVAKYGPTKWSVIAKSLPGRIGKQCRERWHNHLNPDIKKDAWTLEEELVLMNAHRIHGNKWAEIAKVLPGRTDNSIKNHWNSSLKKKLDFYLATGKLPPVAKSNFQLGGARDESKPATDSSKLLPSSNKESDSSAQTSSGTTDNCKPDESKNQLESSDPIQLTGFLSDKSLNKSADLHHLPQTGVPLVNGNVDDTNGIATPLKPQLPTCGSLFYEPLQNESCSPLASTYHLRPEDASPAAASPAGFFTPPCVKINSPESILRFAASTFPNTPSIMRKRKATPQSLNLSRNIDKSDVDSVKDRCSSSVIDERTQDRLSISGCQDDGSCESLASHGHRTLEFYSRKSFNASPPYRLRSKRTGVFKSVEKQLDFTADSEKSECDAKAASHPLRGHSPGKEEDSSHATRKGVT